MSKIAVLFSGQGAQVVGMGKDFYQNNPTAKKIFDLGEKMNKGTLSICFEGSQEELTKTENAQPCLFLTSFAMAEVLKENGIHASAVAGFSLGEIPALAYSGILSFEDAFKLVVERGKIMAQLGKMHQGAMAAALKLDNSTVEEVCKSFKEIWPVNYNCPGQLSCAGSIEEIDDFCKKIIEKGGRAVKLQVSGAFHTPYMNDASVVLKEKLNSMEINKMNIDMYSNKTGRIYPTLKEEVIETIAKQVCSSVQFESILRNMYASGIDTFIEVGAGKTLSGFVKRTLQNVNIYTINDLKSLDDTLKALKEGV